MPSSSGPDRKSATCAICYCSFSYVDALVFCMDERHGGRCNNCGKAYCSSHASWKSVTDIPGAAESLARQAGVDPVKAKEDFAKIGIGLSVCPKCGTPLNLKG